MPRTLFTVNAPHHSPACGFPRSQGQALWSCGEGSGAATVLIPTVGSPSIPLSASQLSCIHMHSWCICRNRRRVGPQHSTVPPTPRRPPGIPAQVHAAQGAPQGSSGCSADSTGHLQLSQDVSMSSEPSKNPAPRVHLAGPSRALRSVFPLQTVSAGLQETLTDVHLSDSHFQRTSLWFPHSVTHLTTRRGAPEELSSA